MVLENRRKWAIGYAILCILYFAVSVAVPHDKLESRGLEGIGKPSLKLKTEEITDETELSFSYHSDGQPLSQLSFYFTADNRLLTEGSVEIAAYASDTEELLGSGSYELADLGTEAFWGIEFFRTRSIFPAPKFCPVNVVAAMLKLVTGRILKPSTFM